MWAESCLVFFKLRSCWLCGDEVKETGELYLVKHCFIWLEVIHITSDLPVHSRE